MKFAAGVTLYNPTEENIRKIEDYASLFYKVFVYDNSEPFFAKNYAFNENNIVYINSSKNDGLCVAYNTILGSKELCDCDFLCTLDQDSCFSENDILKIQKYINENIQYIFENTGIVAPFISYYNEKPENNSVLEKEWVITSGSFLNLNVIRKFSLKYDENYFIDKFEVDLCKQIKLRNLSIKMFCESILYQQLGEPGSFRHPNHSPLRHYYLFRNRFYFNSKFFNLFKCWSLNFIQTLRHILLIVLYETRPLTKIFRVLPAFLDYSKNRMGKCIE